MTTSYSRQPGTSSAYDDSLPYETAGGFTPASGAASADANARSSAYRSYNYYDPSPYSNDESCAEECSGILLRFARHCWAFAVGPGRAAVVAFLTEISRRVRRNLAPHRLLSIPHAIAALWVLVLLWGESWVFHNSVERCHWSSWENWPPEANPHHLVFVADPQLIDAHTYPGRPWPLSSLTILITDNYLRRSYNQLVGQLYPDTIFFLGDLFDGGREWKTAHGDFSDPSYSHRSAEEKKLAAKWNKKYGEEYWLREYARFSDIFVEPWTHAGSNAGPGQRGRRLIANLPGNHDLGFGSEVKFSVRNRFEAYFGEGNRVDVIGNHTFVSVDTVSLSAGTSEEAATVDLQPIYKPTEEFLDNISHTKRKAVAKELLFQNGEVEEMKYKHIIEELEHADFDDLQSLVNGRGSPDLPSILLTHVPLYRPPGTACGPMREHWPPTKPAKGQTDPVVPDHRNAITVAKGYQYQNVLNQQDSVNIIKKIGNVVHAFSGDDHDYCELTHDERQDGVPEITVKSISMAMGVPTPAFLMVSMYNPVDSQGKALPGAPKTTLQTHLCLLPNQLSTYVRYIGLIIVSLVALTIRALLVPVLGLKRFAFDPLPPRDGQQSSYLPLFNKEKVEDFDSFDSTASPSGYSASRSIPRPGLGTRDRSGSLTAGMRSNGLAAKARNGSPRGANGGGSSGGGGGRPQHHHQNRPHHHSKQSGGGSKWGWADSPRAPRIQIRSDDDFYDGDKWKAAAVARSRTTAGVVLREIWTTAWRVTWLVVVFWIYLARQG